MRRDEDAMMVVRADLTERLAMIQRLSQARRPNEFFDAVHALRDLAAAYQFAPVVQIAEALESLPLGTDSSRAVALYLDRMHDAIGCGRGDRKACEALLASVSIRRAW